MPTTNKMWSFKDKNPGIQLSHFIILCAGAFLGSIVTQIISPGGNWENCRHVGISTPNPTALTQSSSTTATQSSSPRKSGDLTSFALWSLTTS